MVSLLKVDFMFMCKYYCRSLIVRYLIHKLISCIVNNFLLFIFFFALLCWSDKKISLNSLCKNTTANL